MKLRLHRRPEDGMTLVELAISLVLLSIVIVSADAGVTLLTDQSTSLVSQTKVLDQLQLAQQSVVRDIHALTSWCATPTSAQLEFVADIDGGTPSFEIAVSTATGDLTLAENPAGACSWTAAETQTLATGLETSAPPDGSGFVPLPAGGATWTGASGQVYPPGGGTPYFDDVGVYLAAPSGKNSTTRISDPAVEVWNQRYLCESSWTDDPPTGGGTSPC
jgi:prepilin-type N-terminal cleavage/methylation domain-containing protein